MATISTDSIGSTTSYGEPLISGGTSQWTGYLESYPKEMTYRCGDGEDEIVTFKGLEIKRLKEMLDQFIKDNHPEDLL